MSRKKIILFIVEGANDLICLELVLKKILSGNNEVAFDITNGDITSNIKTTSNNILKNIGTIINEYKKKRKINREDFLEIVHIIDTDGTYIDNTQISLDKSKDSFFYDEEKILTNNIEGVIKRNKAKGSMIDILVSQNKICGGIPYGIYYFSCNADHVLHGIKNMSEEMKNKYAHKFEDKYCTEDGGNKFLELMKTDPAFLKEKNYRNSWEFIKRENNSLKRYTNLYTYVGTKIYFK